MKIICEKCGAKYEIELPKGAKITRQECSCSEAEVEKLARELYREWSGLEPDEWGIKMFHHLAKWFLQRYRPKTDDEVVVRGKLDTLHTEGLDGIRVGKTDLAFRIEEWQGEQVEVIVRKIKE